MSPSEWLAVEKAIRDAFYAVATWDTSVEEKLLALGDDGYWNSDSSNALNTFLRRGQNEPSRSI